MNAMIMPIRQSVQHSREGWVEERKKAIRFLEGLEPSDRLELMLGLKECNDGIAMSANGWVAWLVKSPQVFAEFTEPELREVFEAHRAITLQFIQLDVEATKKILEEKPKRGKKKEMPSVV